MNAIIPPVALMFQLSPLAGDAVASDVANVSVAGPIVPVLAQGFAKILVTFGYIILVVGAGLLRLTRRIVVVLPIVIVIVPVVASLPGLTVVVVVAGDGQVHFGHAIIRNQVLHANKQAIHRFKTQLFSKVSAVCLEHLVNETV